MKTQNTRGSRRQIRTLSGMILLATAMSAQAELTVIDDAQPALKQGVIMPIPPKETWHLRAGDKMSDVMSAWCKSKDWALVWDAPEIVSEVDVNVEGKFESVIEMIIDALNRSGAGIRAVFYDANHILRVTEKKQ